MRPDARLGRRLAIVWVICYSWLVRAHATGLISLSQEARTYDYESLAWAAGFGLMGGVLGTIVSLMSPHVILLNFWRTLARDVVLALIGGAVVYVLVQWLATVMPTVFGKEIRMIAILLAGASRGRWKNFLADAATDYTAGIRAKLRAGAPPVDAPPSSVQAILPEK